MVKRKFLLPLFSVLTFLYATSVFAADATYQLMQPLVGKLDGSAPVDLTTYLVSIYQILIGVTGVLAVVRIVFCGIKTMATASPSGKSDAKTCIGESLLGLLIAVSSWAILNTISPQLTSAQLDLADVNVTQKDVAAYSGGGTATGGGIGGGGTGAGGGGGTGGSTGSLSIPGVSCPNSGVTCGACSFKSQCSRSIPKKAPGVSDAMLLSIMKAESSCGTNLVSNAGAYGLMQMLPSTANLYRQKCGVQEPIGREWLLNKANFDASICIASYYIQALQQGSCGDGGNTDRMVLAAYNGGPGVCRTRSSDCANDAGCSGTGSMRTWQCPYDDGNHRTCNTGYQETRNYVNKQCN